MLESLAKAFQIPELKKRILFNLVMFALFVIGTHIPAPGVDHAAVDRFFNARGGGGLLGLVDVFSGGALRRMSLFAMGITPYINASIIMQMLTLAIPQLEAMSKEGESGRKRIAKITRYLTIGLSFVQAAGFSMTFGATMGTTIWNKLQMWICMTAGTCFLLWIGEQVTEKGIGNGVSLVIFAGIMTSLPYQSAIIVEAGRNGLASPVSIFLFAALFVATILGIVYVTQGQRKIPIQHVKRVVGMRVTQQSHGSFLPIRVNTAGVIPIIFAISIVMLPAQILQAIPHGNEGFVAKMLGIVSMLYPGASWYGAVIYAICIVIFTYFYTSVVLNVQDMADNLRKYGNFIPGIRPGKPTFDYLDRVVSRITLAGAVFLAFVALIQYLAPMLTGMPQDISSSFNLVGGTSLLIVVGVAIETMQAIEAQMLMRNYEGFIKSSGMKM